MAEVLIRRARRQDVETITTFNAAMAAETEHLALDRERLRSGVEAVFADPAKGFYLVAEHNLQVVGQLMVTYEWSDWRNGTFWWIQSVYVDPEFRGQGIFQRLYRTLEAEAVASGTVCGLRLYVERDNTRAQKVYTGLGMSGTAYQMLEVDFVLKR